MDYKILFNRTLISLIFVFCYSLISFYNFQYIFYLILLIYFFILVELYLYFKKYKILIMLYILLSFVSFLYVDLNDSNFIKFNLMIITVISFDSFSYLFGKLYGKNKLMITISPNKTIEGLIGGIIFSFIFSVIYLIFFKINITIFNFIFIILLIASSFCGDILESIFKRINKLKNSSNFLFSHGGFFDRFDSFVLCIIVYSFFNRFV